jgi:hypothetical protein
VRDLTSAGSVGHGAKNAPIKNLSEMKLPLAAPAAAFNDWAALSYPSVDGRQRDPKHGGKLCTINDCPYLFGS